MRKFKQSTIVPLALAIYLIVMIAVFGMQHFYAGEYIFFFSIIGATSFIIIALHFLLKRKEKLRKEREDDLSQK